MTSIAGPPGSPAYKETASQDWSSEGAMPCVYGDLPLLTGGTGGPGELRRAVPPLQREEDEKGEGAGGEGVLPHQAQPAGQDGSTRHSGTRVICHGR